MEEVNQAVHQSESTEQPQQDSTAKKASSPTAGTPENDTQPEVESVMASNPTSDANNGKQPQQKPTIEETPSPTVNIPDEDLQFETDIQLKTEND